MDDKDLEALLAELRSDRRTVRERLLSEPEEPAPEAVIPEVQSAAAEPEVPECPGEPEPAEAGISESLAETELPAESDAPDVPQVTVRETLRTMLDAEEQHEPLTIAAKPPRTRTRDALVGVFLTLFAVIGLIASAKQGILLIRRLRAAHSQETAVMNRLLPLVLMDIPDFESPDALSDETFLTAAVWEMITADALQRYPENYGMCTVPQADVIAAGNALFASSRQPECRTIGFTGDVRFYYDAEQNAYVLPCDPVVFTYEPKLTALTVSADGEYTALVHYYAEQPHWKQSTQSEPVKTVTYTLRKTDAGWQVLAARQAEQEQDSEL